MLDWERKPCVLRSSTEAMIPITTTLDGDAALGRISRPDLMGSAGFTEWKVQQSFDKHQPSLGLGINWTERNVSLPKANIYTRSDRVRKIISRSAFVWKIAVRLCHAVSALAKVLSGRTLLQNVVHERETLRRCITSCALAIFPKFRKGSDKPSSCVVSLFRSGTHSRP